MKVDESKFDKRTLEGCWQPEEYSTPWRCMMLDFMGSLSFVVVDAYGRPMFGGSTNDFEPIKRMVSAVNDEEIRK